MVVVFTDGSVLRGVKSGWGFSARVDDGVVVAEDRDYFEYAHGGEGHA